MKTRMISMICGLVLVPLATSAQHNINGKVSSDDGSPMFGAKIHLEGTYAGAFSDVDGTFTVKDVKNGNYILSVSYVGFETEERSITVSGANLNLDFSLKKSPQMIEEMLVQSIRANEKNAYNIYKP